MCLQLFCTRPVLTPCTYANLRQLTPNHCFHYADPKLSSPCLLEAWAAPFFGPSWGLLGSWSLLGSWAPGLHRFFGPFWSLLGSWSLTTEARGPEARGPKREARRPAGEIPKREARGPKARSARMMVRIPMNSYVFLTDESLDGVLGTKTIFTYAALTLYLRPAYAKSTMKFPKKLRPWAGQVSLRNVRPSPNVESFLMPAWSVSS